ncbi:hypothetical protein [Duganella vulcania]|uniref:Uncharacterized protein n=1 Tax=Duganella vulcania TaxID=2692166 RepID=A0A845GY70_9BURK|nr:hypothetical protein [Duganella vulcania]MYM98300.1 hypothetical protein [Duganella vulcania]
MMIKEATRFQLSAIGLACMALLAGCGGGGGGSGGSGGAVQTIAFDFPGGAVVGVPPTVATTKLVATASSGGPVTFTSNTPTVCTVSGDTVSLLVAGECSVTATQSGYQGYAAASHSQIFVIPKRPQMVVFRNPGWQALDAQPVTLAAATNTGQPVVFTTSTPAVCSVSGTSLSKLANGLCVVTATQEGSDIFAKATTVKNIPIGTEQAAAVPFLTGYKDTSQTKELGTVSPYSGSSVDGWYCGSNWCGSSVSSDGASFTYFYNIQPKDPAGIGAYWGIKLFAGTLTDLAANGDTLTGVRIDAQAAVKFNMAMNSEWFSTSNNAVNVDLALGHFAIKEGKACNVTLRAVVKPTAAAATDYSVSLRDKFTINESCGLTGLDLWNELQDYPISKVEFSAAGVNTSVSTPGAAALTFTTKLTLTGAITFQ